MASEHLGITDVLALTFGRDLSSPSQTILRDQPNVRWHGKAVASAPVTARKPERRWGSGCERCAPTPTEPRRNACGRYLLPAIGVVARPSVSSISVPHGSVMNAMRNPVALVLLRIGASVLIPAACSFATNASMFFTSKPM